MPHVEVNLLDQGGRSMRVRLPSDVPVRHLSWAIRRKLNMPEEDDGKVQIVLHHKASGRDLAPERSLGDEKVADGDVLRLRIDATGGARRGVEPRS